MEGMEERALARLSGFHTFAKGVEEGWKGRGRPVSLRDRMPLTAAFVDDLREAFGAASIDAAIRQGLKGHAGWFHAVEAGSEIGTAWPADHATHYAQPCLVQPMANDINGPARPAMRASKRRT